jgi:antitoxin component YwqK of YwqJK toxin-antitoxin module
MDGLYTAWHENGQKQVEGTYKDGKVISEKWWNSKGEEVETAEEADE